MCHVKSSAWTIDANNFFLQCIVLSRGFFWISAGQRSWWPSAICKVQVATALSVSHQNWFYISKEGLESNVSKSKGEDDKFYVSSTSLSFCYSEGDVFNAKRIHQKFFLFLMLFMNDKPSNNNMQVGKVLLQITIIYGRHTTFKIYIGFSFSFLYLRISLV